VEPTSGRRRFEVAPHFLQRHFEGLVVIAYLWFLGERDRENHGAVGCGNLVGNFPLVPRTEDNRLQPELVGDAIREQDVVGRFGGEDNRLIPRDSVGESLVRSHRFRSLHSGRVGFVPFLPHRLPLGVEHHLADRRDGTE
jgi:hypothetical protein